MRAGKLGTIGYLALEAVAQARSGVPGVVVFLQDAQTVPFAVSRAQATTARIFAGIAL